MAKAVHFDVEARQRLKRGIDIVSRSVRITLGPKGSNVVLEKKFGVDAVLANTGQAEVTCLQVAGPMGDLQRPAAFVVTAD
jgi:chaperonin GroEL (HSP60 family)